MFFLGIVRRNFHFALPGVTDGAAGTFGGMARSSHRPRQHSAMSRCTLSFAGCGSRTHAPLLQQTMDFRLVEGSGGSRHPGGQNLPQIRLEHCRYVL